VTARGWLGIVVVMLLMGGGGLAWVRAEGSAPEIRGPQSILLGAAERSVALELIDEGSGLRQVAVGLTHARGEAELFAERYPGSWLWGGQTAAQPRRVEVRLDPERLNLADGGAVLSVAVRDWSWRGAFRGNETRLELPVTIDLVPPQIAVESGLTYVRRGGSGAVVYTVSEATASDGVRVGETFFRGFPLGGTVRRRVALFAVPADAPADPPTRVVAEDAAGNTSGARWPVVVQEAALPIVNVTLTQSFLETKVRALARAEKIRAPHLKDAFRTINTRLRGTNEAQIRALAAESSAERLWDGAFLQLRNSKVTSRFAERRSYFVDGQRISEATHYGFDLASTAAAPITAANAGRVRFASEIGIYGSCVLVDHGLGLTSLYGHLSRIDVAPGDEVEKGQQLGLSGATGLAGGDHLHFAILVGGTYVDPLEWWDARWVQTHVETRLRPSDR
jgi:murein DD-endopeptidase MepM/ murein hydrolase activator NlpD